MASTFLKDKLNQAAQKSAAFQAMELEQQAQMIADFENATDQQVIEAIKALEEEEQEMLRNQQLAQDKQQHLAQAAANLEQEVKQSKTVIQKSDQHLEDDAHDQEIASLENQMSQLNKTAKPKKKWFFGLF